MSALLTKRRLRWLGHVIRMPAGRLPRDILYGELASGSRQRGRPTLRFKDVCKRDMKAGDLDPAELETLAADRGVWRSSITSAIDSATEKREEKWKDRRARRHERAVRAPSAISSFSCNTCNRTCRSRIGLYSHSRRCNSLN